MTLSREGHLHRACLSFPNPLSEEKAIYFGTKFDYNQLLKFVWDEGSERIIEGDGHVVPQIIGSEI